ncbi:MAG: hypothetical protein J5605_01505 [Bacteroidales bacterium]|nr:hypothetical protein [Bacteroidales bacterium]
MKKVIIWGTMCLMAMAAFTQFGCDKNKDDDSTGTSGAGGTDITQKEYVDLGLPSGTKWKITNEINPNDTCNFYTYDEAVAKFGSGLPTKEQCIELKEECVWTWKEDGCEVVGPNGKSIFLLAAGYRNCSGNVNYVGSVGGYWSSTPNGSEYAWGLLFYSGGVGMDYDARCFGRSVRLVQD